MQHGHSAIDNLIAMSFLRGYQGGGEVLQPEDRNGGVPSLTDAPISRTQKFQDFLTKITEGVPLIDWLYHSPEESFDKSIASGSSFKPRSDKSDLYLTSDDVKELWKQAGKPRVKTHKLSGKMSGAGYFEPKGHKWDYGRRNPMALLGKLLGSDTIYIPEGWGKSGTDVAISELAHSMRFKDPKRYSKYETRHDLLMGKGTEHAGGFDKSLYGRAGTDEYQTHEVVEPKLRKWLMENYGKDAAALDEYYENLFKR
jgi:hypothetical protein